MRFALAVIVLVVVAGSAAATPRVLRDGANHHLGDDSFVARFGRSPTTADSEDVRMHVHFTYVHDLLAATAPTKPELAERRAQLLGYLNDYIAKGTTPRNTYVLHRSPVFIDRDGTICAVGYLIERSAGRDVAERIAATHRLDYLEDIAGAMPEVAAWVASSGFTLDELASIQPGYLGPDVMHLSGWLADGADDDGQEPAGAPLPPDGPYHVVTGNIETTGAFAHHRMTGAWTVKIDGKLRGSGVFGHGAGTWTSVRVDGTRMAEGAFSRNHATGTWSFFHPSGHLAARGTMKGGMRDGKWTFFYDADHRPKLSVGAFSTGETLGTWKHYDLDGNLIATSSGRAWSEAALSLDIEPGASGVRHIVDEGIPADSYRLDSLLRGKDRLYIRETGAMYDGTGHALEQTETGWLSRSCSWSSKRKAAARVAATQTLFTMLREGDDDCDGAPERVGKRRAKQLDSLLAARKELHAPIPSFDIAPRPPAAPDPDADATTGDAAADELPVVADADNQDDLGTYLAAHMTWYIEWPHVDDSFRAVYETLPGYTPPAPE